MCGTIHQESVPVRANHECLRLLRTGLLIHALGITDSAQLIPGEVWGVRKGSRRGSSSRILAPHQAIPAAEAPVGQVGGVLLTIWMNYSSVCTIYQQRHCPVKLRFFRRVSFSLRRLSILRCISSQCSLVLDLSCLRLLAFCLQLGLSESKVESLRELLCEFYFPEVLDSSSSWL